MYIPNLREDKTVHINISSHANTSDYFKTENKIQYDYLVFYVEYLELVAIEACN